MLPFVSRRINVYLVGALASDFSSFSSRALISRPPISLELALVPFLPDSCFPCVCLPPPSLCKDVSEPLRSGSPAAPPCARRSRFARSISSSLSRKMSRKRSGIASGIGFDVSFPIITEETLKLSAGREGSAGLKEEKRGTASLVAVFWDGEG